MQQKIAIQVDCVVELAEPLIMHRASCFEGNTAIVYTEKHNFSEYLRCEWSDRGKLCTAVSVSRISQLTNESEFPAILVENGNQSEDDRFIEVHVFGPMTPKTFESVSIDTTKHTKRDKIFQKALEEKLSGINFEVITT